MDPSEVAVAVTKGGAVVAQGRPEEDPAATVAFVRRFLTEHGASLEPAPHHRRVDGRPGRRRARRRAQGPIRPARRSQCALRLAPADRAQRVGRRQDGARRRRS